jgi:hypothetical protein
MHDVTIYALSGSTTVRRLVRVMINLRICRVHGWSEFPARNRNGDWRGTACCMCVFVFVCSACNYGRRSLRGGSLVPQAHQRPASIGRRRHQHRLVTAIRRRTRKTEDGVVSPARFRSVLRSSTSQLVNAPNDKGSGMTSEKE